MKYIDKHSQMQPSANYTAGRHPLTGDIMWKLLNPQQHISLVHEFITTHWNPEYTLSFYDQRTGLSMEITNEVEELKNDIIDVLGMVTNTEHSFIDWVGVNSLSDSYVIAMDFSRGRFKPGTLYKYQNKQLKSL